MVVTPTTSRAKQPIVRADYRVPPTAANPGEESQSDRMGGLTYDVLV